jgi:hypothetical protein
LSDCSELVAELDDAGEWTKFCTLTMGALQADPRRAGAGSLHPRLQRVPDGVIIRDLKMWTITVWPFQFQVTVRPAKI